MAYLLLRHTEGSLEGTESSFDLEEEEALCFGRESDNDIVFDPHADTAASGHHARLLLQGGAFLLEDLNSSNGTFVNGERIQRTTPLCDGDVVLFGGGGPQVLVRLDPSSEVPETIAMPALDPAHPAESPTPSAVGAHTVALMINQASRRTTRKFALLLLALAALLVGCIALIVFLTVRGEVSSTRQQEELDATKRELEKTRADFESAQDDFDASLERERNKQKAHNLTDRLKQKQAIERQISEARIEVTDTMRKEFEERQAQLVETLTSVETRLNRSYGKALYMLSFAPDADKMRALRGQPPQGRAGFDDGFCTAFAVTPDGWLASNAHCIDGIFELRYELGRQGIDVAFFAKRNGDSKTSYPLLLETAATHPRYTHAASPDVGLVKLDLGALNLESIDHYVVLGSNEVAQHLEVGEPIYTLGFPGKVMDPYHVNADFRGGNIARLTDFESADGGPLNNHFVWHTALISKGTSGSPMFDRFGRVVAINNGTMSAEKIVTSDGAREEVKYIYSADGLNFGVRVDFVRDLLARKGVALPPPPEDSMGPLNAPEGGSSTPAEW